MVIGSSSVYYEAVCAHLIVDKTRLCLEINDLRLWVAGCQQGVSTRYNSQFMFAFVLSLLTCGPQKLCTVRKSVPGNVPYPAIRSPRQSLGSLLNQAIFLM